MKVTGAYYLDGQNVRIQASLTSEPGAVIYAIEPQLRTDPGKAVDLVRQRMPERLWPGLDPNLGGGRMSRAINPLYSAYREYKAGLWGVYRRSGESRSRITARAIELDPDFFDPWYQTVLANRNMADYKQKRPRRPSIA